MTATAWPEVPLGEVADVRLGRQRSPKHHVGQHMRPYVRAANVGWSGLNLDDVKKMNFTDAEMETYRLVAGDLLLGEASGSPTEVGKPAIWNGEIDDCAFQNTLLRVRPLGPDPRFLLHFFRYQAESGRFAARSRGVGIYHLGRKALADLPVPLPPVEEQQRIAAILDAADKLRAKRRESVAMLDSLTESIFLDMFGDPVPRTMGWPSGPLADLSLDIRLGTSQKSGAVGSPVLRIPNVKHGSVVLDDVVRVSVTDRESARLRLLDGDLLFVRSNGNPDYVGRCATFDARAVRQSVWADSLNDFVFASYLIRVRLDRSLVEPAYVEAFLTTAAGRKQLREVSRTSAGQFNINSTGLGGVQFAVPPLQRQQEFVGRCSAVKSSTHPLVRHLNELDALFASLQYRAFRGEL